MISDALIWGIALGTGAALHCAGMCGAIGCAILSASDGATNARPAWQRLASMQVGRVASYVLLGLGFGSFGAGLYQVVNFGAVHLVVQWLAALVIIWIGLSTAGLVPSLAGMDRAFAPIAGRISKARFFLSQSGPELDLVSGLVWGLTPCPLVYLALFNAVLLGSPEKAMLMMLAFGLVTSIPVMLAGLALYRAAGLRRGPSRRLSGLFLVAAGVLAFALTTPGSPLCIT